MDDGEDIHALAAAYVAHALDPEEARAFERHLVLCERCREEVASLQDAVAALAYGIEGPPAPPALRERIIAEARRERGQVVPMRRRWALPAAAGIAAAAAAAALGLGLWAASLSSSLDSERSARRAEARALALLAQPGAQLVPLAGANGSLVVDPTRAAVLVVRGLEPPPAGKTYEAWVIAAGGPKPAGLFAGGAGRSVFALTRPVPPGATVGVTLEPAGGVERPTGAVLFRAQVS